MDRIISEKLLQEVADYLISKPFIEVHKIIQQLMVLPKKEIEVKGVDNEERKGVY